MLRQAIASDIPGIQRVRHSVRENRLVSTSISDNQVREAIESTGRGWVIEAAGEVVGFAIGNATNGNIWALFVHPDHERRGYGRLLHDTMVEWLWSRGLERLWLTTEPSTRAQGFYESAGWRCRGSTDSGELRYERTGPSARVATAASTELMANVTHTGGCHCGRVRFEVIAPARIEVTDCDCSICSKSGYLHLIVPKSRFKLLSGTDALTTYEFNTNTAKHLFCSVCGIKAFYVPRSHPDGYSVNARCLDEGTVEHMTVKPSDGKNWEKTYSSGRGTPLE